MRRTILTGILVLATCGPAHVALGQDLGELVREVGEDYAELYLQPLANALGADMNTGLFHSARIGGGMLPLVDVYAGVKVMGALVPDSDRSLSLTYQTEQVFRGPDGNRYTVPVTFNITDAPTVFGETTAGTATATINETVNPGRDGVEGTPDDVVIDTTATFDILPGLIDTPIAPFVLPQFGIGSFMGTDLTVRYLPRIGYEDYGSVGFVGVGVRHSLSQYIPLAPVSLSAQVMWQKLSIEDDADDEIFAASSFAGNVAVSKSFLVLTVYGGLQVERSSVDVEYTFVPDDTDIPTQHISFGMTGDNTYRVLGGAALNLGPMLLNVDASLGSIPVVSAGLGVSL